MLKKTLIATAAISATLLAVAAVLPALAQSRSCAPSTASAAQRLINATAQDKRGADGDSHARKTKDRQDLRKANEAGHEGR
jgi:uncharacterized low-complexity protein